MALHEFGTHEPLPDGPLSQTPCMHLHSIVEEQYAPLQKKTFKQGFAPNKSQAIETAAIDAAFPTPKGCGNTVKYNYYMLVTLSE